MDDGGPARVKVQHALSEMGRVDNLVLLLHPSTIDDVGPENV